MFSVNANPAATTPAYTTPSSTPSNSRRRNSSSPSTNAPFSPSSTHGATNTALNALLSSPSTVAVASSAPLLSTRATSAAKHAPHRKATSIIRGGSGSQRSSQRNAATTGPTGSNAPSVPTITPPGPTL